MGARHCAMTRKSRAAAQTDEKSGRQWQRTSDGKREQCESQCESQHEWHCSCDRELVREAKAAEMYLEVCQGQHHLQRLLRDHPRAFVLESQGRKRRRQRPLCDEAARSSQ